MCAWGPMRPPGGGLAHCGQVLLDCNVRSAGTVRIGVFSEGDKRDSKEQHARDERTSVQHIRRGRSLLCPGASISDSAEEDSSVLTHAGLLGFRLEFTKGSNCRGWCPSGRGLVASPTLDSFCWTARPTPRNRVARFNCRRTSRDSRCGVLVQAG